jgi:hypothetical protein
LSKRKLTKRRKKKNIRMIRKMFQKKPIKMKRKKNLKLRKKKFQ